MGAHKGVPRHYLSPESVSCGGPCMCKPGERSFIINIWYSYILRGIVIISLSGAVVVTFVPVSASRMGLWV